MTPRAVSPLSGEVLPLHDLVADHLGRPGVVAVVGGPQSGKTTALRHLLAVLPPGWRCFDADAPHGAIVTGARDRLVVYAREYPLRMRHRAVLELAAWTTDELIEYLLSCHRERCASVMARLGDVAADLSRATPGLWRAVLDLMAGDERVHGRRDALCRIAARCPPDDPLLSVPVVATFRAVLEIVRDLEADRAPARLDRILKPDVLREAGHELRERPGALHRLRAIADGPKDPRQPMAVSLLHAAGAAWWPGPDRVPVLRRARLPGIRWPGVEMTSVDLRHADLGGADLSEARLTWADVAHADLRKANLAGALLRYAVARHVDLRGANLAQTRAPDGEFHGADLRGADCRGALLENGVFDRADLRGTDLRRADLRRAHLTAARIRGADFRGANLEDAVFESMALSGADLRGAQLARATLTRCSLAACVLPGAQCEYLLAGGLDVTGARMPHAHLRGAVLRGALAADVDWEGADLRGADLRQVTFHMGSSRSGLVESFLASEGTRTGFYTDDGLDQHFKSPEEIRKANLRGADLRGALVEDTDFYLVDLRDARYDEKQADHFRRCGAILKAKIL